VACLSWGLYAATNALRPPVSLHIRLAAGSTAARKLQIAETLAADARERNLYVELVATKHFEGSIRKVATGELDLAMVSSGREVRECDRTARSKTMKGSVTDGTPTM
jgi:hypothetical protein